MSLFAHVVNGIVVEVEDFDLAPSEEWIETDYGIRNQLARPGFIYDPDLDIFFMPIMEEK